MSSTDSAKRRESMRAASILQASQSFEQSVSKSGFVFVNYVWIYLCGCGRRAFRGVADSCVLQSAVRLIK